MESIKLTEENLEKEHICCAISSNRDPQVTSKKGWLKERFADGLVFLRADTRGKCFIEYIPAEKAWLPIEAENYMHINCFWVSGASKGHGYSSELLRTCIADAKAQGKSGLSIISSEKKKGFLSDPKYLQHKGFLLADTAEPYFTLLYLPFSADAAKPVFRPNAKQPALKEEGFTLYYTSGCPFTAKYVPVIENLAEAKGIAFEKRKIETCEQAQNAPMAWTNYGLFYNGTYITHEILSEKKFERLCETLL